MDPGLTISVCRMSSRYRSQRSEHGILGIMRHAPCGGNSKAGYDRLDDGHNMNVGQGVGWSNTHTSEARSVCDYTQLC